jgi:hypothetical protein
MPLRTIDQAALVKSTDKSGNSRKMRASRRVLFCGYSIILEASNIVIRT